MLRQRRNILLLIGLCCAGLGGCANLKLHGDADTFGSAAAMSDPVAKKGLPFGETGNAKEAEINPLDGPFALARLCERRGEDDQAKHLYHVLIEKTPENALLYHRLGVLAVKKGNFTEAEEHFRKNLSLAPATAELLNDRGYCQYLQHRFPEAEALFVEALKLEPNHAASLNNLALVVGRQGRVQESLDLFKRTNSEAEAYANLAYVLAQNGELAKSEQAYLYALTLDNKMRAAAHAMLQINEYNQTQSRLENLGPLAAVAPASEPAAMSGRLVRLPQTDL